jgi:hypothetical protein
VTDLAQIAMQSSSLNIISQINEVFEGLHINVKFAFSGLLSESNGLDHINDAELFNELNKIWKLVAFYYKFPFEAFDPTQCEESRALLRGAVANNNFRPVFESRAYRLAA